MPNSFQSPPRTTPMRIPSCDLLSQFSEDSQTIMTEQQQMCVKCLNFHPREHYPIDSSVHSAPRIKHSALRFLITTAAWFSELVGLFSVTAPAPCHPYSQATDYHLRLLWPLLPCRSPPSRPTSSGPCAKDDGNQAIIPLLFRHDGWADLFPLRGSLCICFSS